MRGLIFSVFLCWTCKFGYSQLSNFIPSSTHRRTDNLYSFDTPFDVQLSPKDAQIGRQIDLLFWFPFYGSRYNYTVISKNGYIAFAQVFEEGLDIHVGPEVNWPEFPDPAMIAPYMCPQRYATQTFGGRSSGVRYKLLVRPDLLRQKNVPNSQTGAFAFRKLNKEIDYVQADKQATVLLKEMKNDLADGMVGAENFEPDIALVVTWQNMTYAQASAQDEADKAATYQMVFLTDKMAQLSYVILNYHSLNFAGSDIMGNMKRGRCTALLNGGNHTGSVFVDPMHTRDPKKLATMSAVPHRVSGRYLFRADDVVKRGGCSNVTAGTYRMVIYPDTVNMLGETVVQINGPCFDKPGGNPPQLFIGENRPASCRIKNSAIAECRMDQFYQWGLKDLFLRYAGSKAYVGTIYYAPVGLDPYGIIIDDLPNLFQNPPPQKIILRWYTGNFTDRNSKLRLILYAYEEVKDVKSRKFVNTMQKLVEIDVPAGFTPADNKSYLRSHDLTRSEIWNRLSLHTAFDISRYSFGVLKLGNDQKSIWSPPIPFHWLWSPKDVPEADQPAIVSEIAARSCIHWFDDDGTQWNFVQHTEYNAPCPCLLKQAYADFGRFMPHPRCSRKFRNVGCDVYVGAHDCFLSAQNIISNFATHYGQVCCYDENGYLMQTAYASVKPHTAMDTMDKPLPYSPGFPQRAYELGTPTFHKQYETPILSNYFHDVMPYYMCCKWSVNRCQFFYWRRPSSGCQEYQSPKIASVFGAGHFTTFQNTHFTVLMDGIFTYFHKANDHLGPEVNIQIRLEKYPNRQVDPSHRSTLQENLVEPTDSVVVTGVAIQESSGGDTDRVMVLCRKDTRRLKYRISVLVNDEIRYFDTMKMQKFKNVMIYINDVREGQSEVYITLLKSRIGLRIRESFGYVIGLQPIFEESMGLLDVQVSVPPDYFQIPNNSTIFGLANGIGYQTSAYKVDETTYTNLFTLKNTDHKDWPESSLLKPIYKFTLPRYFSTVQNTNPPTFYKDGTNIPDTINNCLKYPERAECPSINIVLETNETCSSNSWCIFDVMTLFQKQIGARTSAEFLEEKRLRNDMENRSISCASINIQYPEYLYMEPARGGYLHGDNVQFLCFQNSWLKGDDYYQCRFGHWTKGSQPWCRERSLEFTLRYVAVIFGILLGILFIASIFLCCYCVGKKKRVTGSTYDRSSHTTKIIAQPKIYDDDLSPEHESPIPAVPHGLSIVDNKVRYKTHTSLKPAEIGSGPKSWTFTAV